MKLWSKKVNPSRQSATGFATAMFLYATVATRSRYGQGHKSFNGGC